MTDASECNARVGASEGNGVSSDAWKQYDARGVPANKVLAENENLGRLVENPWYNDAASGTLSSQLGDGLGGSDDTSLKFAPTSKIEDRTSPARSSHAEWSSAGDAMTSSRPSPNRQASDHEPSIGSDTIASLEPCDTFPPLGTHTGSTMLGSYVPVTRGYSVGRAASSMVHRMSTFPGATWTKTRSMLSRRNELALTRQSSLNRRTKSPKDLHFLRIGSSCQLETEGMVGRGLITKGSPLDMLIGRIGQAVAIVDVFSVPVILCFDSEYVTAHALEKELSPIFILLYTLVLVLSLFTAYIDVYTGKMVIDFQLIRRYVMSRPTFWCDVFTIFVQVAYLVNRSPFFKYAQLFKYVRCWRFICDSGHFMGGVLWSSVLVSLHEGLSIICYLLVLIHNFGCLWWKIGGGNLVESGHATVGNPYLHAVTETTLMMLGIATPRSLVWDDSSQLIYVNIMFLIGSLCVACIYSQFVIIMQRLTMMESHTKSQLALVWSASNSLNIPQQLRIRITGFHRFKAFIKQHAHEELMAGLSRPLLLELKLFLLRHLIKTGAFFADLEPQIISELLLGFDEMCFSPGDLVIKKDDPSSAMYFIIRGVCKVLGDVDGPAVAHLVSGDFFGEMALLFPDCPRTAFVMCASYCMLASISVAAFQKVVEKENPAVRATVMRKLADFLRKRVPAHKSFDTSNNEVDKAQQDSPSSRSIGSVWKIKSKKGWVGTVGTVGCAVGSVLKDSLNMRFGTRMERPSIHSSGMTASGLLTLSKRETVASSSSVPTGTLGLSGDEIRRPSLPNCVRPGRPSVDLGSGSMSVNVPPSLATQPMKRDDIDLESVCPKRVDFPCMAVNVRASIASYQGARGLDSKDADSRMTQTNLDIPQSSEVNMANAGSRTHDGDDQRQAEARQSQDDVKDAALRQSLTRHISMENYGKYT